MNNPIDVFTAIYETCAWGNNHHAAYQGSSGDGSDVQFNIYTYVPFLRKFIVDNKITSVVDLGCGDFRCGPYIYDDLSGVVYHGYDAYNKVIENNRSAFSNNKYTFTHLDFFHEKEAIAIADLCILKDVIQHWPLIMINTFLDDIIENKRFKYIMITNCSDQIEDNTDIAMGEWRPLSCDFYPLKKYNPIKVFNYYTKEVCVIIC